jgi:SNF2 family DNA or RNA helicase
MLSWTDNDQSTLTNFKSTFCNFGGFGGKQIVGYRDLDLLKDELDSCSLRRTFDMVRADMPLKTVEYEIVEMSDEHRKFYEAVKDGVKEEADLVDLHPGNLLALTTRLRQATAAPSVLTSNPIESSKVLRAAELAEDLLESGEKVVIFSTFVEPCTVLADKLARYNPLLATGEIPDPIVSDNISKFRNSDNFNLLIGTHGKLGTGFSMPECHYSIIIDTPWTDATLQQSIDRIYRITSDQPIFVKILCCADTIDERVKEIVENKRDLSDFLVDGKMSPGFMQLLKNIIFDI